MGIIGERISCEYDESSAKLHAGDLQRSDVKPIVDNESDDSDSGIFRVKRPSSLKAERRNMNAMSSKHSEQQVCEISKVDLISPSCISTGYSVTMYLSCNSLPTISNILYLA